MDSFLEEEVQERKWNPSQWSKMNFLQRGGVICGLACMPFSYVHDPVGTYFGVASWTILFLGYVSGALWKVRHSLHFWWSLVVAAVIHCTTLPAFIYFTRQIRDSRDGRSYIYLAGGLMSIEVIAVVFLLKHAAMWLHSRSRRLRHGQEI